MTISARTGLLLVSLLATIPAGLCRGDEPAPAKPAKDAGGGGATGTTTAPIGGAAPGNEHGPGGFVPRGDLKTFYAATGDQLWYYLNLYYWAPEGVDTKDLWIRVEVVEVFENLKRFPEATPVASPEAKTTVEYWRVGPSRRTVRIDNHKDFWLESECYCAGQVSVTMTLQLGRVEVKEADGKWSRTSHDYILDRKSYDAKAGIGAANIRFEPLRSEPVNVWEYAIPWSECPRKFLQSHWEALPVPTIRLRTTAPCPPPAGGAPVTTEGN